MNTYITYILVPPHRHSLWGGTGRVSWILALCKQLYAGGAGGLRRCDPALGRHNDSPPGMYKQILLLFEFPALAHILYKADASLSEGMRLVSGLLCQKPRQYLAIKKVFSPKHFKLFTFHLQSLGVPETEVQTSPERPRQSEPVYSTIHCTFSSKPIGRF